MKFCTIYDKIIHRWPEEIILDDNGTTIRDGDGHLFPSLSRAWHTLEDQVGFDDPWLEMMVWTMFQVFHTQAKERLITGMRLLNTRAISRSEIEKQYFENLQVEERQDLLALYERVIR